MSAINWNEAMEQVGGDMDFLYEVLQDLVNETVSAKNEMTKAIAANDFEGIRQAGHRIKGSASYLSCGALCEISKQLQDAGHDGVKDPSPAQMTKIKGYFEIFTKCLADLEKDIEQHKKK